MDAVISLSAAPDTGPLNFEWNTGQSEPEISGLTAGTYIVTVTDENGCFNILEVVVDIVSSVGELSNLEYLNLMPNPTNGESLLALRFNEPTDLQIQVLNTVGQEIFNIQDDGVLESNYALSLQNHAAGIYLVRLMANGKAHTLKLIKTTR